MISLQTKPKTKKMTKMRNTMIFTTVLTLFLMHIGTAQNAPNLPVESYFKTGKAGLDTFMSKTIVYPPDAKFNSIAGLSTVSFKIDCSNVPYDIQFETKIGYGIEDAVIEALSLTKGSWINCNDASRDGRIKIKIAFSINNAFLPADADSYVNIMEEGNLIMDDRALAEKINDQVKKEKYAKAKKLLDLLMLRYPYNEDYIKLMHQLEGKITY